MEDSKKEAHRGILHGTVYRAGFQEKGRGRIKGRHWLSEKGLNLMFTLVLRRDELDCQLNHLPLMAGSALTDAVRSLTDQDFRLKWPNDLLYKGKKCAGILCEADNEYFYCGMGINCNQTEFPPDLGDKVVSLKSISHSHIDLDELLMKILKSFQFMLKSEDIWRDMVEKYLYLKNEEVAVQEGRAGSSVITRGINRGIGDDGQLLVETEDGSIKEIYAGEIEI